MELLNVNLGGHHNFNEMGAKCLSPLENIALGKPAYQSSTDNPPGRCAAGGAVDGRLANDWSGGDQCAHTLSNQQAWWAVDLGQVYTLDYVTLTNRINYGMYMYCIFYLKSLAHV